MEKVKPKIRCAIYTRKSSEEGLEQEFNSLHAQREAAESYIASQKHEGWHLLPDDYDDGGFSGGNMERPALKRLRADIEAGRVDIIVVYKVDRLSRSLGDFARLVDLFDEHKVSFVSITQQFNTTTSMGRLTLNILLSFAQFEREVTSERIRDKFALSRKKGKWMGGRVPLGYKVEHRRLVIESSEARLIRKVFRTFVETRSVTLTSKKINEQGYKTRDTRSLSGKVTPGRPFDKSAILKLLQNRTYIGEVIHRGTWYSGEHQAIVSQALWDEAHSVFKVNPRERRRDTHWYNHPSFLKGFLFEEDGTALVATSTRKNGKLHRYYVSNKAIKRGYEFNPLPTLPAREIEPLVVEQLARILKTPETTVAICGASDGLDEERLSEQDARTALGNLGDVWNHLFPEEQRRIMKLLVRKITIAETGIDMEVAATGLHKAALEMVGI